MKVPSLVRLAFFDLRASRGRAWISSSGIGVGVAVLILIVGLGLSVRNLVLREIVREMPVDIIEVVPRTVNLGLFALNTGGLLGGKGLTPETATRLGELPGAMAVYPKLDVRIPMGARGGARLFGHALYADLFMLGVPTELIQPEVGPAFADREDVIPVVVSDQLLEVYNTSVASSLGTPHLTAQTLTGFEFDLVLGQSLMLGTHGASRVGNERARIVGVSRFALRLGVTVPIETARRILQLYGPPGVTEEHYSAVVVRARTPSDIPDLIRNIEAMGFAVDNSGKRAGNLLLAATLLGSLVGLLVLGMAALSIAHSFFAQLSERRREMAVLRAVGARQLDLVLIILFQAAVLGLAGGVLGMAAAHGSAVLIDWGAKVVLPDFPFKPASFFVLPLWLDLAALLAGTLAACLGALWPAVRAARAPVALSLSQ